MHSSPPTSVPAPDRDRPSQPDAAPRSGIPTQDDTALAMLSAPEPVHDSDDRTPLQTAFMIDEPLQTPDYRASQRSARSPPQSRSRQNSAVFPLFHSSLPYALVRDFAYPPFNPLHYGPLDYAASGRSTPTFGRDYDSARRLSDPPQPGNDRGVGPWGDSSFDRSTNPMGQQLPSTSFVAHGFGTLEDSENEKDSRSQRRYSKHRKSKSYASMQDFARGRQRISGDGFQRISRSALGNEQGRDPVWQRASSLSRQVSRDDDRQQTPMAHPGRPHLNTDPSDSTQHPPFREDGDQVPYSPQDQEDHRPESASLDESFAGPSLALYDFAPEHDNELALREGQIIQVGYRHGLGWLVAMDPETGEQGLVPEEYVRLLRDIEGWGEEGDAEGEDDDDGDGRYGETTMIATTTTTTVADETVDAVQPADGQAADGQAGPDGTSDHGRSGSGSGHGTTHSVRDTGHGLGEAEAVAVADTES